jgi:hypothetical protein
MDHNQVDYEGSMGRVRRESVRFRGARDGKCGVKTRAGKGHEFGLKLSANEKKALIAFLKTL